MKYSNLRNNEQFVLAGQYFSKVSARSARNEKGVEVYVRPDANIQRIGFGNTKSHPLDVAAAIGSFQDSYNGHDSCKELVRELNLIGWACQIDSKAKPYGLRKVGL